ALEGVPFIIIAGLVTVALFGAAVLCRMPLLLVPAGFGTLVTLFIVFFFRNPQRVIPADERALLAPADGQIIYLGPGRAEHLDKEMTKISIFMSVFNVHINRAPLTARVVDNFYVKGKFLDVRDERATFENERNGLVLETREGVRFEVVQVAGLIARRIVCYPKVGDWLTRGDRYGLIRFGSRLDVYLPAGTEVRVGPGDKTVAGETILGMLP
ncbi:MAG TPA: phosphatidylserine decarboxylase family protein, partial [Geobacteraceae bacterium]